MRDRNLLMMVSLCVIFLLYDVEKISHGNRYRQHGIILGSEVELKQQETCREVQKDTETFLAFVAEYQCNYWKFLNGIYNDQKGRNLIPFYSKDCVIFHHNNTKEHSLEEEIAFLIRAKDSLVSMVDTTIQIPVSMPREDIRIHFSKKQKPLAEFSDTVCDPVYSFKTPVTITYLPISELSQAEIQFTVLMMGGESLLEYAERISTRCIKEKVEERKADTLWKIIRQEHIPVVVDTVKLTEEECQNRAAVFKIGISKSERPDKVLDEQTMQDMASINLLLLFYIDAYRSFLNGESSSSGKMEEFLRVYSRQCVLKERDGGQEYDLEKYLRTLKRDKKKFIKISKIVISLPTVMTREDINKKIPEQERILPTGGTMKTPDGNIIELVEPVRYKFVPVATQSCAEIQFLFTTSEGAENRVLTLSKENSAWMIIADEF